MKPSTSMFVRCLLVGLGAVLVVAWVPSRISPASELPKVTQRFRNQTCDERRVLVLRLIEVVRTGDRLNFRSPASVAVELLGDLRASEAVDVLARDAGWHPTGPGFGGRARTRDQTYLAAWSLAEIGMPSVPAMLRNLAESDDEDARDRSAWVINKVFMGKKAAARVFLEDAIKEAKHNRQRERLIAAREFFE